ncbi:MAG: hypothetical protein IPM23_19125 [Candidatus Melainabacteria bacterium]|nr:hypothetical protein [Candidatus Melainabacteria bacterium]
MIGQIKHRARTISVAVAVAATIGIMSQHARADEIRLNPVGLNAEVVKLLDTSGTATLNASGEIVTTDGKIIGVITPASPSVTVVKSAPGAVVIHDDLSSVLASSLNNRIAFLKKLVGRENQLGHVPAASRDDLVSRLAAIQGNLNARITSDGNLTFDEALSVGNDLDSISHSLKRASEFRLKAVALEPMVVVDSKVPTTRRLTIFRTVKHPDGEVTTETTTTTRSTF